MGSVCGVEEAGVEVGLWTPVGRDVVGCRVVGSVRTLGTLLWSKGLPVWLDTLALGRLSVHCELNVSVCELNEQSAVGSSSMRSLVLLESMWAFAE